MKNWTIELKPKRKNTIFKSRRHKRSMSDMFMTSKDIFEKEEKAYNLFSNRPPKDILAILNLNDENEY